LYEVPDQEGNQKSKEHHVEKWKAGNTGLYVVSESGTIEPWEKVDT
jgi:hypothetical protein